MKRAAEAVGVGLAAFVATVLMIWVIPMAGVALIRPPEGGDPYVGAFIAIFAEFAAIMAGAVFWMLRAKP